MQWTEDLAVGIDAIDTQHKELFRRINNLVLAIKDHRCKTEIDGTIDFLEEYAKTHFSQEEAYMRESRYENLRDHQSHHATYLQNLAELKRMAAEPRVHGVSYELSVTANQIVVDWIVDHIMKIDRQFGAYMKNRKG